MADYACITPKWPADAPLVIAFSILKASFYQRDPSAIRTTHFPSACTLGIDSYRVQATFILNQPTCRFVISRYDFRRRTLF